MPKIHVLLTKEEIDEHKISEEQIMVVFDVLLATTTIISALKDGAKEVIPVLDMAEARQTFEELGDDDCILAGEYDGLTLDGFYSPNPLALRDVVKDQTLILSTTNGTVAVKKSASAHKVYCASLLNNLSVSKKIKTDHTDQTIVIVCAGSGGVFNIEDFYGAGHLLSELLAETSYDLTDSAFAALTFYEGLKDQPTQVLQKSSVGRMLSKHQLDHVLEFVAQKNLYDLVPELSDGRILIEHSSEKFE